MLHNNEYFNQLIVNSQNIQNKLSQFTIGLDIETIIKLIDDDIQSNHSEEEIFKGKICTPDMSIKYTRTFCQYNAVFICDEWANEKQSRIEISRGKTAVIIAGNKNSLAASRNDGKTKMTLEIILDTKTGMMDIKETAVEPLDETCLRALKESNGAKTKKRTLSQKK